MGCNNGACGDWQEPPPPEPDSCHLEGQACDATADCCEGRTCENGQCQLPAQGCALPSTSLCDYDLGEPYCCGLGLTCDRSGTGDEKRCCAPSGGLCTSDLGCCGEGQCVNYRCQSAQVANQCNLTSGQACNPNNPANGCCTPGHNCEESGSGTTCCRAQHAPCANDEGCCGDLVCSGGVCIIPAEPEEEEACRQGNVSSGTQCFPEHRCNYCAPGTRCGPNPYLGNACCYDEGAYCDNFTICCANRPGACVNNRCTAQ